MQISKTEFHDVIENARPEHLWKKNGNKWVLKKPIWEENK